MGKDTSHRLLRQYLDARTDAETDLQLTRILNDYAKPIVRRIVGGTMRGPARTLDAEDVVSDALAHLLRKLRDIKRNPADRPITDLRGYIAATAYNSCHEHLRERYRSRTRLRNHLQYLLKHDPHFAIWKTADQRMVCGYRGWEGLPVSPPDRFTASGSAASQSSSSVEIESAVETVFRRSGAPVDFETLVNVVAETTGTDHDVVELPLSGVDVAAPVVAPEAELDLRFSLRQLWSEILQLPRKQRAALLLNLRDAHGREIITLLPHTRTATITEIANAVGIPPPEFADMWNDLPLDDHAIGRLLGATRPQVIKLRRLARERLRRRMKRDEFPPPVTRTAE